jgi:hypothetical protein
MALGATGDEEGGRWLSNALSADFHRTLNDLEGVDLLILEIVCCFQVFHCSFKQLV